MTKQELLELQKRYRAGEIKEEEMTEEQVDELEKLYDEQIDLLEKMIELDKIKIRKAIKEIKEMKNKK